MCCFEIVLISTYIQIAGVPSNVFFAKCIEMEVTAVRPRSAYLECEGKRVLFSNDASFQLLLSAGIIVEENAT